MNRGLAASVVVLSSLAGLACSGGDDSTSASGTAEVTTTTEATSTTRRAAPAVVLRAGLCFDATPPTVGAAITRDDISPIDCAQPHHYELFATLVHPASRESPFPPPEALFGYASDQCLLRFESYVGQVYQESSLDIVPVEPDKRAWDAGDRELACAAFRTDLEPLIGSIAHTGL